MSNKEYLKNGGNTTFNEKLTWELVDQIRKEYRETSISAVNLAKKYGFSRPTISNVLTNRTWKEENRKK